MKLFILILGILQVLAGVLFAIEAASAIHQILAAVAFGLGVLCMGIAAVIDRLEKLAPTPQKSAPDKQGMDLTGTKGGGWKQA